MGLLFMGKILGASSLGSSIMPCDYINRYSTEIKPKKFYYFEKKGSPSSHFFLEVINGKMQNFRAMLFIEKCNEWLSL